MGLVILWATWALQDPRVPLPSDVDRSVPLEIAKSMPLEKKEDARPLVPLRSPKLADRPDSGPSLGGFLFWSSAVLALLVGVFVLLKRFGRGSRFLRGASTIDVLARRGLAPKQEVLLVEIGGRVLILGSTRERISTLGELSDPDEVAKLKTRLVGGTAESASKVFGETLRSGLQDYERIPDPEARDRGETIAAEVAALKKTVQAWKA